MSRKKLIILFLAITGLYWFSLYTYVPILSPYAEKIGAGYKMIGFIVGSYGFSQMIIRIPFGIISDKYNKRKLFIILGLAFSLISAFGMFLFNIPFALLISRALSGVAASSWVIFSIFFTSFYNEKETSKSIGYINSVMRAGQMAAIFFGGFITEVFSYKAAFISSMAASAAGLALCFLLPERVDMKREPVKISSLFKVAGEFNILFFSFLAILVQFVSFSTVYGFTPVIAADLGAASWQLGALTGFSTLPAVFGSALSGAFFIKKMGYKNTLIFSFLLMTAACISIPYAGNILMLFAAQIVGGFGTGIVFPVLMSLAVLNAGAQKRATAMGFFQAIYGIGMFLGPSVTGAIGDNAGLKAGFYTAAGIAFSGAVLSFILFKKAKIKSAQI